MTIFSNSIVTYRQRGFVLLPVVMAIALVAGIAFLMNREGAMNVALADRHVQSDQARYVAEAGFNHQNWQVQNASCTGYTAMTDHSFGSHTYSTTVTPTDGSPVSITATGTLDSGATRVVNRSTVPVYETTTTDLVLQPDAADGKDTYLYKWQPSRNFGISTTLWVRNNWADSLAYSFLSFDVSNIPSQARVTSAVLELRQNTPSSQGGTVGVRRILSDWIEGTANGANGVANWNDRETGVPWASGGGDFDSTADATSSLPSGIVGWYQWDITTLVSDWVRGAQVNRGLTLFPESADTYVEFDSSDQSDPTRRPKLTITYACECGVDCATEDLICSGDYIPNTKTAEFSQGDFGASDVWGITYLPEGVSFNGVMAPADGAWIFVDNSDKEFHMTDMAGSSLTSLNTPSDKPTGIALITAGIWSGHLALADAGDKMVYFVDLLGDIQGSSSTVGLTENPVGVSFVEKSASGTYDGHLAIASDKDSSGSSNAGVYLVDQNGALQASIDVSGFAPKPWGLAHLSGTDKLLVADKSGTVFSIGFDGTLHNQYDTSLFGPTQPQGLASNPLTCDHVIADKDNSTLVYINRSPTLSATADTYADTYIYENSGSSNYGSIIQLLTGEDNTGPGKKYRSLVQFDISTIPAGATVTSATLRLYQESSVGNDSVNMDVHKVTAAWDENTVTWNNSGGGSYDAADLDVVSVPLGTPGWVEWTIPPGLIQDWIDSVSPNYGLLVNYGETTKNRRADFVSREHGTAANHPQLVIEYTEP